MLILIKLYYIWFTIKLITTITLLISATSYSVEFMKTILLTINYWKLNYYIPFFFLVEPLKRVWLDLVLLWWWKVLSLKNVCKETNNFYSSNSNSMNSFSQKVELDRALSQIAESDPTFLRREMENHIPVFNKRRQSDFFLLQWTEIGFTHYKEISRFHSYTESRIKSQLFWIRNSNLLFVLLPGDELDFILLLIERGLILSSTKSSN